jgi:hypothetical protein
VWNFVLSCPLFGFMVSTLAPGEFLNIDINFLNFEQVCYFITVLMLEQN